MELATGLLLLFIGIIAGAYGTIVGAGGGFIFVPALLLLLHMDPAIAAASGLVIVFINSLSGIQGYARQGKIHYKAGLTIALGALPGALIGVWLLQVYSSSYFYVIFASILVGLGVFLLIKNSIVKRTKTTEPSTQLGDPSMWFVPLGFLMGILSSYLGIGGGWLLVPILIYVFKIPTHTATATSIFSLCLYTSVGVAAQLFYNSIDWITVLWGGMGVMIGAQLGVVLAKRIPGKIVIQMLSVLLIVIGFRMFFQ
ncbi:sulfite exporter TauE/SafE family protein [Halobacillus naozhouensis]|uniref:Probable membrane transporter protein n=1 Tax=Halobacillus naozhouensis TaxID=554880 RepID=A0ABY8IW70_9BACI|nr:sulfite exporter TauE/SafE family protein [Halobacillus naozhouensis]WFT74062.1 sulfite exporter TauE/SafE family protein [Halobacillus naozhouensis]